MGGSESNFLFNAKNQITLWGPHGEINDYSTRQWNGLVGDYHYHRWTEYLKTVEQCVVENRTISLDDYHERMMTPRPATRRTSSATSWRRVSICSGST